MAEQTADFTRQVIMVNVRLLAGGHRLATDTAQAGLLFEHRIELIGRNPVQLRPRLFRQNGPVCFVPAGPASFIRLGVFGDLSAFLIAHTGPTLIEACAAAQKAVVAMFAKVGHSTLL
jgi:hypothetical protein